MIKAKKQFGQNFLQDSFYLEKIISAMPEDSNTVVEIGPGLGDLTSKLLNKRQVISIEVDKELESTLRAKFSTELSSGSFRLIMADATAEETKSLLPDSYDLVANLPYYVATNIVLNALSDKRCKNITVLVQKEVAHKFCSNSRDSDYGSISVLAEIASKSRSVLFDIPPEAFMPAPKVVSSVMRIDKKENFDQTGFDKVSKLLRLAFAMPRKTIMKNLSLTIDKSSVIDALDDIGIEHNKRPHEITAQQFLGLSGCLIK